MNTPVAHLPPSDGRRFAMEVQDVPRATVLALAGELDHDTAEPVRRALDAALRRGGRLLVDVSRLDFCDSTGLNLLLHSRMAFGEASAEGVGAGSLELVGLRQPVARMFHLTGADRLFRIHPDVAAALAAPRHT
ncbi:STAS domain-containing protein [Streptomyces sp. NBC_00536]|uniref:STAS domain-containing protein n=1 Tax=Streptomyces sp. NBC_00536 TaxID=2975769 RepID=UPI002E7FF301|nr:STAS domain-containing protein [Streptomyces sp. NBC_00536]WUC82924.1 STAS domain-containing protein [Streptomyces sp. NBC_00536]